MANVVIKNDTDDTYVYTVTIMHGNVECTDNTVNIETTEVGPKAQKVISVTGP